ncbi:hypothetical protein BDY21DRAFT_294379 [Lineolata rhizophorae]|uniref:Inositolphosphotransferase Aur1/Ipt1 domain-containing protein n=1 Tax=Lineolata rhizophorae TaxID=578093 RepID=A0A6A6NLV1_9PEZI|nr:hypothetical protein BDY21DRAFT_294379 [Lineolata rhizophorae]
MGAGAFIEPLIVVTLLFGGTWVNRNRGYRFRPWAPSYKDDSRSVSSSSSGRSSPITPGEGNGLLSPSLLPAQEPGWRKRELRIWKWKTYARSPNTRVFKDTLLSRLLRKFPFLVEAWYWALIYWVYQLGRAFTAVHLSDATVDTARKHALQVIHVEQRLHMFIELPIQRFFLRHPFLLTWTNRVYSFIHIPGTILFLVWLYHFTTTARQRQQQQRQLNASLPQHWRKDGKIDGQQQPHSMIPSPAGPRLYEARRRTMAVCNLLAFVVFTLWPCMPPRLLSDERVPGAEGAEARSYGFVDTVHGNGGEGSVWTHNKFCNQYAAMPSLHFGYSLLIGLTIVTIPLPPAHRRPLRLSLPLPCLLQTPIPLRLPSARRAVLLAVGTAYPAVILAAIVATANHFVLDAVAGALVCGLAWCANGVLLNLLWLEDWFLWVVRIHKPDVVARWGVGGGAVCEGEDGTSEESDEDGGWGKGKGKGALGY